MATEHLQPSFSPSVTPTAVDGDQKGVIRAVCKDNERQCLRL